MNFHKTIGFLATLLLILGLGVPDVAQAQTPSAVKSVSLSLNKTSVTDKDNATAVILTATVTLAKNAIAGGQDVTVTLVDSTATSVAEAMRPETGDFTLAPDILSGSETIVVSIAAASKTGSGDKVFTITPDTDDAPDTADEVIGIGGVTDPGDKTDVVELTIEDTDNGVASIDLSLDNMSFMDTDNATAVILTAMATLESDAAVATTVTVTLTDSTTTSVAAAMQAENTDFSLAPDILSGTQTIEVPIAKNSRTGSADLTFTIDPAADDAPDTADEVIAIHGSEPGGQTDVVKITIEDTDNGVASVGLSLNKTSVMDDDDPTAVILTAMVTLESNAAAETTVTVTLADATATRSVPAPMRAESGDFSLAPDILSGSETIVVTIAKDSRTGSADKVFTITPDEDTDDTADDVIAISGSEPSGKMDVVKLTIIDTDNSVASVDLSLDNMSFTDTDDATAVTLTAMVTLKKNAAAAMPVTVTLVDSTATSVKANMRAESGDFTLAPDILSGSETIVVTIAKNSRTGSADKVFTIDPTTDTGDADDDNETIAIGGSEPGGQTDVVKITIRDADNPLPGAVTSIELSPATLSVDEGAELATTVTVKVNAAAGAAQAVTVTLSVNSGTLADLGITSSTQVVSIDEATKATSGTVEVPLTYMAAEDDNTTDETITITGTVGEHSDMVTLTVSDNDMGAVASVELSPATLSVDEGGTLATTVTVKVNVAAGAAADYNVVLSSNIPLPVGTINSPVTVPVAQGAISGTAEVPLTYMAPEDDDSDNETITITGMVGGQSDMVTLTVSDNDMGAVASVELSPATLSVDEGGTLATAVTVKVNVVAGATALHNVELSATGANLADLGITSPARVPIAQGATSGTAEVSINYTAPTDTNLDDETITITGMVGGQSDRVTLTVADQTVPEGTITISTSLENIRESGRTRPVEVTATLDAAPATGTTVMVTVTVTGGTAPVTTQIPIVGPATSGTTTVSITPVNDDVFTVSSFTVTGKVTGYKSGTASIGIVDDDASSGTITVTSAPPSATVGRDQTMKLTVHVVGQTDTPQGTKVVVNLATDTGTLNVDAVTVTLGKHPDQNPETYKTQSNDGPGPGAPGTANLMLDASDASGGTITVTASADMYETGTRTIPITDRDALDIAGYRAVLVKPAANGWAPVGNDKVIVDVIRIGSVAYPWTDFESIKVSVRDTARGDYEIDAVTARGFSLEDGTLTFEEPASRSRGDVQWKGNDTVRFEIRIRPRNDQGSTDPAANGQYLGAYAHVEFASGGLDESLTNRESDKAVYPANPTLIDEANRYRGDGKLFKVDNLAPSNAAIAAVKVTSGDEVGGDIDANVGDEVRVAVKVSGDVLFRDSKLRIQIQAWDNNAATPEVMGRPLNAAQIATFTKTKTFNAAQVIASTSDSLYHTWTINEGFFTYKTDDFVDFIGPRGTTFQPDNTKARVLVAIGDQAGNWSGFNVASGTETRFDADSRSPSVSILYPSADPDSIYEHTHPLRFSGAVESVVEGVNVDAHLNPLAILVDEDLSALKVFAVGADTLDIFSQIPSNVIGDSMAVYDTSTLSSPKKDGEGDDDKYPGTDYVPSSANRAGTEIELAVLATDILGNTTKVTIANVTHDASPPVITDWFPKNSLLPDGQINDATPPVFTLSEDVDSIAVTFEGSDGSEVTKQRGGVTTKGEDSIDFTGALKDEIAYDMMIFVRDLAGNVFITPADSSANMRFNAQFDNPVANRFNISTAAESDSVIAGQANILTIQAEDHDAGVTRNALTYKNAVRISAWDADGGAAESVWFEGTGVDDDADNPDGVAMLSAADWRIGKRSVTVKSNMATGAIKILVQHVSSGQGDTAVLGFESAKDLYVGAADFAGFEITAWEEGVEGAVQEIWGNYTLRVVPVDRHGNASVRAFKSDPSTADDSLAVLDTRVGDNAFEYKNGLDVEIIGVPTIEDFALLILSIEKEGANYDLVAPDDRRTQTVQVRVANESLKEGDSRSQNVRSSAKFNIRRPPMLSLTLWVPGSDMDEAGNDVSIPADPGTITVTVRAEGFNEGDMVTFTRNGTAMDPVAADADGNAPLMITASMASTTTVSASSGRYSTDDLEIVFVEGPVAPARKSYVDANGDPVYLISEADMTVGVDDFLALVAAFGSSDGDDNYNAQADVDDDGTVGVADFLEFLTSWGRTAVGPATKPLVLLPGINENAEFSLSLGSERVVAGELVAVDVSLANVAELIGYGFALNYETDKFEFVSVAPADEDLLKSTGGETLFHHVVADGQITVANGLYNGTAVSGGGDAVRFVFRVLREFEDNARFEIADGLVFDPSQLQNPAVVAGVLELQSTPREFALHQNFPNPFNPDTTIKYDLAESADVTLQIYNVLGQVVRTLVASEAQNAGRYQIRWNGMDDRGVPVSSGIYFYQIAADGKFSDVRKLMLLK